MTKQHRELMSIGLTLFIVYMTLMIVHRFIPSMIWAVIIVISTYPVYRRLCSMFGQRRGLIAFFLTAFIGLFLLLPLSWLITLLVKETQIFFTYIQHLNQHGGEAPEVLIKIPVFGTHLANYWNAHIGKPGLIRELVGNLHMTAAPLSYYVKQIGIDLAHRGVQLGFTLITLFFFYRDAEILTFQVNRVGEYCLGNRWQRYANGLPRALRATVNGTILVGLGVGVIMGLCYLFVGFPAPTLFGFLTAIASMIPFAVPIVFAIVALVLFAGGQLIGSLVVIICGTLVMFISDHFIKPTLIGGAIKLPFLAVLFGILGGVETMGLLGLFAGPMVMVLFITLWYEPWAQESAIH